MKRLIFILLIMTYLSEATFLSAQECVKCDPTSTTEGNFATALGQQTSASGSASLATGVFTTAQGSASTAMGFKNIADGDYSFSLGSYTQSSADFSFAIGDGYSESIKLNNNIPHSLVVGFHSDKPTLFIGMSKLYGKTSRIAIGNVVDVNGFMDPQAKLPPSTASLQLVVTKTYSNHNQLNELFNIGD